MMEIEVGVIVPTRPSSPPSSRERGGVAPARHGGRRAAHVLPPGVFLLLCFLLPILYLTFSEHFFISETMYKQEGQQRALLLLLDAPMDLLAATFGSGAHHQKTNTISKDRPGTTTAIREITLDNMQKVFIDTSFLLLPDELEAMNMAGSEDDDEDSQDELPMVEKEKTDTYHTITTTIKEQHHDAAETAPWGYFSFAKDSSTNRIVFLNKQGFVANPPPGPHDAPNNHRDYNTTVDPLPPIKDDEDLTRMYALPEADSADYEIERRAWPVDELDPENCEPMYKWQSKSFPTCNSIHEMDMEQSAAEKSLSILSDRGYWRYVWKKFDQDFNTTTVWKTLKIQHKMEEAYFENSRIDALAMERLTASPYVINVYGFCGLTVVQEFADRDLGHIATMSRSPIDRLDLAIQVAQGMADVHGVSADIADDDYIEDDQDDDVRGPSIVHNDVNLANIMITRDNRPVMNDFNVAIFLKRHKETGETCPFFSKFPNSQWRAPEEQVLHTPEGVKIKEATQYPIVTSKADVYALGNLLFRIAHVRSPWKQPGTPRLEPKEKEIVARAKRFQGQLPEISPSELQNVTASPYVQTLHEAIEMCFRYRPEDRPTAKEIVQFLKDGMEKSNRAISTEPADDTMFGTLICLILLCWIVGGIILIFIINKRSNNGGHRRRDRRFRTYT